MILERGDRRAVEAAVERVRGAIEHEVYVVMDGVQIRCGSVFIRFDETLEIDCGRAGAALIRGVVVDARGTPIDGVDVTGLVAGDVRERLRGGLGSDVVLRVRDPHGALRDVTLTRVYHSPPLRDLP